MFPPVVFCQPNPERFLCFFLEYGCLFQTLSLFLFLLVKSSLVSYSHLYRNMRPVKSIIFLLTLLSTRCQLAQPANLFLFYPRHLLH